MNDIKRTARDAAADVKETYRKADGNESLGDKVANVGDRVRNAVEDAGDTVREEADRMSREASYEKGRMDELNRSR
ncbi:MAG: hypothetical protein HYX55_03700 [Chloroflexi bacterium]|nr:hypothetical protein [Chloroflexota bacterium]